MPRVTRQSVAHEAALLDTTAPSAVEKDAVLPSHRLTSSVDHLVNASTVKQAPRLSKGVVTSKGPQAPPAMTGKKRKRTSKAKVQEKFDVNELPHGLGRIDDSAAANEHALQNTNVSLPAKMDDGDTTVMEEDVAVAEDCAETATDNPSVKAEDSGLEEKKLAIAKDEASTTSATGTPAKKRTVKQAKADPSKPKRVKKVNKYGVELGVTPYPDWPAPSPEQAHEVNRILSEVHGEVRAPKAIPLPSLTVAGCGEVPNILEALMRTLLSAHTTNKNAGTAIQGMIKKYGTVKDGHSKGNVNWNAVRLSSREEVEEAIKHGGLAKSKSRDIWKIVEMVYDENNAMRKELAEDGVEVATADQMGIDSDSKNLKSKSAALFLSDPNILTLDYMHVMPAEEAFAKFITFPGIGVKTASCTLLFCMQRPSFAVDTHVYRLCQYLNWVPMGATRDTTFAHCDVRIPDELKYSLHQLLIAHGKTCGRCRAITGETSEGWDKGCKLEHLVKRYGAKKGGEDKSPTKTSAKGAAAKKLKTEDGEEDEDVDMERLGDGEEEYSPVNKAKKLAKATKPKVVKSKTIAKTAKKEGPMNTDGVKDQKKTKPPPRKRTKKA